MCARARMKEIIAVRLTLIERSADRSRQMILILIFLAKKAGITLDWRTAAFVLATGGGVFFGDRSGFERSTAGWPIVAVAQ